MSLATLSGSIALTLGGITAVVQLVGSEISRSFLVPEPSGSVLAAFAVLSFLVRRREAR